jgi:hypothetical protein
MANQTKTIGSSRELSRPSILGGFFSKAYVVTGDATLKVITATTDATSKVITATTDATSKVITATSGAVNAVKDIAKTPIQILEDVFIRDRTSVNNKQLIHMAEYYIMLDNSSCFNDNAENILSDEIAINKFYTPNVEKAIIYLTENCSVRHDTYSAIKLLNYYANLYCTISDLPGINTKDPLSTQIKDGSPSYTDILTRITNLKGQREICVHNIKKIIDDFRVYIDQIYVIEANLCFRGIPLYDDVDLIEKGLEILQEASEHNDLLSKFEYARINLQGLYGQSDILTALGLLTTCANQIKNKDIQLKALALIAEHYGNLPETITEDEYIHAIDYAHRASIEFDNDITYAISYASIVIKLHNKQILTGNLFNAHHHICFSHLNKSIIDKIDSNTPMFNKALSLLGQLAEIDPSIDNILVRASKARNFYERAVILPYADKYAAQRLLIASLNGNFIPLYTESNPENIAKYWSLCELLGRSIVPNIETESLVAIPNRRPTSDTPLNHEKD